MAHPKDPKDPQDRKDTEDLSSVPVLTDVIMRGKPLFERPGRPDQVQAQQPEAKGRPEAPPQVPESASQPPPYEHGGTGVAAAGAADTSAQTAPPGHEVAAAHSVQAGVGSLGAAPSTSGSAASSVGHTVASANTEASPLSEAREHDAEQVAERVRARFAGYLREEGRGVIEARCREALEEHTGWLVRQVTREVTLALEAEVGRWVHDAVREALAAQASSKR